MSIWRIQPKGRQGKSRKLVARMALKGEENIASASISDAGDLLAVSTAAEIKVFQIKSRLKDLESGLRLHLRKLESPPPMAKLGAKLVTLSADGRWLAIITHNSSVLLARVSKDEQADGRFKILPKLVELKRLPRKQKLQTALVAPSGRYEHTITRAQFSTDSRVLVVGDLAGHLDSWVLEGHPDPTAPEVDIADTRSSASSVASDDEDEDDEKHSVILFGQHWIPNPSAHLLPKLDSAPLFLSFRPNATNTPEPNGNPAVHPTRHNPHPHSHDLPQGDYRLLVLSAQHRLYEFDILKGGLTDWSRRNPTSNLPAEFQGVRDRAMGCVWDTSNDRERVWLYGSSWLFMFDLARDFPASEEVAGAERKRKRGAERDGRKGTSGAGSRVPQRELPGLGRKMRRTTAGAAAAREWVMLGEGQSPVSDEESEADAVALSGLRVPGEEETGGVDGDEGQDVDGEKAVQAQKEQKNWLCAYKYRPILGMVPIGGQEDGEALEVVLVERPLWDLELPPRFVGSHEKE